MGFQCPFSNLTFDIKPPRTLRDQAVIIGGQPMDATYGEFQAEMDMLNLAFCEVMMEGDKKGRVFTFPIPTINVTKDFEWDSPVVNKFMEITCKYGIPYFSNYINSDLSPEDALSMCCRLRLNTGELRKRGGGLFGSNPLTGSIGVVTVNLPRIGYLSRTEEEFKSRLLDLMEIAKESLEIKRKTIEEQTRRGMYPYSAHYLENVKERTGSYWFNHFNTIGLIGMNEACLNFMGKDITTPEGQKFSLDILDFMRDTITRFRRRRATSTTSRRLRRRAPATASPSSTGKNIPISSPPGRTPPTTPTRPSCRSASPTTSSRRSTSRTSCSASTRAARCSTSISASRSATSRSPNRSSARRLPTTSSPTSR